MKFDLKTALASIALLAGSATIAAAAPATVTTSLNMRTGPGTGYSVVMTLPAGAVVDVGGCSRSWCRISWQGYTGYASSSYLASGGYAARRPPVVVHRPPVVAPRVVIQTPYWRGGYYNWHDGRSWHRDRDDRRWRDWDRRRGGRHR